MIRTELSITEKAVLTTPEAAEYINISEHEIRRLCLIGQIKAFKTKKDWKIPRVPLERLVEEWGEKGTILSELRMEGSDEAV